MDKKILCLGNEFIKIDSLGKKIGEELKKEGYDIINIKDSFQLMEILKSDDELLIIDVVNNLQTVKIIDIDELKSNNILSAHDIDASFVLKLAGTEKNIKIIGIPMTGNIGIIKENVKILINSIK